MSVKFTRSALMKVMLSATFGDRQLCTVVLGIMDMIMEDDPDLNDQSLLGRVLPISLVKANKQFYLHEPFLEYFVLSITGFSHHRIVTNTFDTEALSQEEMDDLQPFTTKQALRCVPTVTELAKRKYGVPDKVDTSALEEYIQFQVQTALSSGHVSFQTDKPS